VFDALYFGNSSNIDADLQICFLCDYFKLPYSVMVNQPAWFMLKFQAYLEGKSKAENELSKKRKTPQTQSPQINKYKFIGRKR
jgi:hypothetical protein